MRFHAIATQRRARARAAGFSLIEVLVAFVILALVATALFRLFSSSLTNASAAEEWSRALQVARVALASAAAAQPLKEASERGADLDGRVQWETVGRAVCGADVDPDLEQRPRRLPRDCCASRVDVKLHGRRRPRAHAVARHGAHGPAESDMTRARIAHRGFTLIELVDRARSPRDHVEHHVRLAAPSPAAAADAGEEKAQATSGMRLARITCARSSSAQHPQRMRKMLEFPLLFGGNRDEIRYTAPLPARVGLGGMWYYRLSVATAGQAARRSCSIA